MQNSIMYSNNVYKMNYILYNRPLLSSDTLSVQSVCKLSY